MNYVAFTDGASRGNPGESGIGVIIRDEHDHIVFSGSGYIGLATNNIAEYEALLACLKIVRHLNCSSLRVYSDSQLMVRQLLGQYRVKDKNLQKYFQEAITTIRSSSFSFKIEHIEREQNRDADLLANAGIDAKQSFPFDIVSASNQFPSTIKVSLHSS